MDNNYYRGFEIKKIGAKKYVKLNKGRTISDVCVISLRRKIDEILNFKYIKNLSDEERYCGNSSKFWKGQLKGKHN